MSIYNYQFLHFGKSLCNLSIPNNSYKMLAHLSNSCVNHSYLLSLTLTVKMPTPPGIKANSPISFSNVVSSSCPIQATEKVVSHL